MTNRRTSLIVLAGLSAVAALAAVGGCRPEAEPGSSKDKPVESTIKLDGVWPDKFVCDSIATPDVLGTVLGGPTRQMDNPASVPRGIPHPCVYEVVTGTTDAGANLAAYWTFDFDCRDGMKQRADALFAQYRKQNSDLIEQFNEMSDAGALKPNDAGIEQHAPGAAVEVAVGAKALDHHGQGVLFIDDDAPCYVRVVGPDAARRLELAKLVAKNLTLANAPMTPRAAR